MLFTSTHRLSGGVCVSFLLILVTFASAAAQSTAPTDGSTPLGLAPGSPSGSFLLSDFESVNPFNGNLNFHLPLAGLKGRGGLGMTTMLELDTKGWTVRHQETTDPNGNPVDIYTPVQSPWVPKPGYGPGILVGRQAGEGPTQTCGLIRDIYQRTITRLTFTGSGGTEYEFRDQLTGGQPQSVPGPCSSGASRGTVFVSTDGTSATFVADSTIFDKTQSKGASMIFPSGYLLLANGTKYRIDNGNVSWMRDRNGNRLTFTTNPNGQYVITDSLNRQIVITYADYIARFYDQISFKGFGGVTRNVLVNYSRLSGALRVTNPRNEPAARYQTQTSRALFPELNNASPYTQWNPWVVSSVTLPNGREYRLFYNCFAELARISLPTGGAIEYDYTGGSGVVTDYSDFNVYRRIRERRVYADGVNLESYSTFSEYDSPITVDHFSSGGVLLSRAKHYFTGNAQATLFGVSPISYPAKADGREFRLEEFAADGSTMLRREETTWENRAPVSWWSNPGDVGEPPNDLRIKETTITLADVIPNLVSKKTYSYTPDSVSVGLHNNVSDVYEFDYGAGAAPPYPKRHTHTEYVTSNNGSSYADPTNGSSYGANDPHLRGLVREQKVYSVNPSNGMETLAAASSSEYDHYVNDGSHAPLIERSNVSGFDLDFGTSFSARGNMTSTTAYLITNGSLPDCSSDPSHCVNTFSQYDMLGNLVKSIDARGNSTTIEFADRFGSPDGEARTNSSPFELSSVNQSAYSFPTRVVNALNQATYTQFDYYLGRPVDAEDVNGTTYSGYSQNEPLDRPTQIVRAASSPTQKSQTRFIYDDVARTVTVSNDQTSYGDNVLKGQTLFDGLGRPIETRKYETSTQYIAQLQVPFTTLPDPDSGILVQAAQTSIPFRPYLGETPLWSTTFVNSLERSTKMRTPDNAIARTWFSGNRVTASDQIGKATKRETNAFGQLTKVWEDPGGANWLTTYNYDAIGNLVFVNQGGQTRTFEYDSLRRLVAVQQPESGTSSFTYDKNGNLLTSTDARGFGTFFSYDELNRPTIRNYRSDPPTPTVKFFYDGQSLPPGAPNFSRGASIGRLVAVTNDEGSSGDYYGYDALGRNTSKVQQTDGINFPMAATYNIEGALVTEQYPSGRGVTYEFDTAGRTASVTGTLGDGYNRVYSTGMIYSARGGLTKEQFGTDAPVFNKHFYNVRGQLAEIRESTSYTGSNDTSWNRGAIINHFSDFCWGMCGGINSATSMADNNGNVKRQEVEVPDDENISSAQASLQWYSYDNLNRIKAVTEGHFVWGEGTPRESVTQTYNYDRWGNRTIDLNGTSPDLNRVQFGVDSSNNHLVVPAGEWGTMQYDAVGNLTADTYSSMASMRTFDAENRMISQADGDGNVVATYSYDGNGRRIKRAFADSETWQVYGIRGQLVAEYEANSDASSPVKEYGYRNGQLLVTAKRTVTIRRDIGPGSRIDLRWIVTDQLGTPRMIFDKTGSLSGMTRHDYLPFGEEREASVGAPNTTQGFLSPQLEADDTLRQKFTGFERDAETELDFAQARYFSSKAGRFISADPLLASANPGNPQSWNRYAGMSNNPLHYIDPSGMKDLAPRSNDLADDGTVEAPDEQEDEGHAQDQMIQPPQALVAEAINELSRVVVMRDGERVGSGVMALDTEITNQLTSALTEAYTRGVEVGSIAGAGNGVAIPTQVGTQSTVTGTSSLGASAQGETGGVGTNVTKGATRTFEVAAGSGVRGDVTARAENVQTVERVAGQLENRLVTVNTIQGPEQAVATRQFWQSQVGNAVDKLYKAGISTAIAQVKPPTVLPVKKPF